MYLHVLDFLLHLEKVFSDCSCYQMTFWFGIIILMHNNLWFEEIFIYPALFFNLWIYIFAIKQFQY